MDVYDPTTGEIRSNSTDDIACWFIDTNYDGESFFVRHAYFTGADEPYEKLKRALRAEIDEAAWSTLYSTVSRPFAPPETGKIAVKVINHYGDEVLEGVRVLSRVTFAVRSGIGVHQGARRAITYDVPNAIAHIPATTTLTFASWNLISVLARAH